MSLGKYVDVAPGSQVQLPNFTMYGQCPGQMLDAYHTGTTTFVFGVRVLPPGLNVNSDLSGIFIRMNFNTSGQDDQYVEFDLLQGVPIPVPAFVSSASIFYPEPTDEMDNPPIRVTWSVGKGYTHRPGITGVPRRTFQFGTIPPSTSSIITLPIPPFADQAVFQAQASTPTFLELEQLAGIDGTLISTTLMGRTEVTAVPLSEGASSFSVANPDPVNPATDVRVGWRIVF